MNLSGNFVIVDPHLPSNCPQSHAITIVLVLTMYLSRDLTNIKKFVRKFQPYFSAFAKNFFLEILNFLLKKPQKFS